MQKSTTEIKKLARKAKKLFGDINRAEIAVLARFDDAIDRAWQFGKALNQLKARIGHGSWAAWRTSAFPKLSERNAQRYQCLDSDNPNAKSFSDLSKASIRKYRCGYIPPKERPEQKDDRSFARPQHHSTVVNECGKLMQRIESGQYKPDDRELLRDFEPFYQWLKRRYESQSAPR